MKHIRIVEISSNKDLDWYDVPETEVDAEVKEILNNPYYNSCKVLINGTEVGKR